MNESEQKLLSIYMNTLKLHKYFWSEIQPEINIGNYVNFHMNLMQFKEDDTYIFLSQKLSFREIKVLQIYKDYKQQAASTLGIGLPSIMLSFLI